MTFRLHPLVDRAGRFSPIKATVFALLLVPGLWTAIDLATGNLGPRPFDAATRETGTWTIRLIFLSLLVTPLQQLAQWPKLVSVRRMVGVAACVYGLAHLALFVVHERYDFVKVASEIVLRIYLTIGFAALLGLAALAVTSTDAMIRRLGAKGWRRLHQAVYVIGVLATVHFFMQSKLNVYQPLVMAGLYLWLMLYRIVAARSPRARQTPLLTAGVLAMAVAAITALGEALYFRLARGVDPLRVLSANLSLDDIGMRPGWMVLFVGAAVLTVIALRLAVLRGSGLRLRAA
ncbi:MAG: sulfoxide reductase heme-binding subunit YedZ [Alphaproteobacteria bacterium]|nr:sulfoxide reductase heme-binding subunit YedZ [Alphaproteobacteria bacterium]